MVRIDMSEYMEKHAVSRLVGSPPGYIGYDEGGQLTEAVRRKPYSVLLLDEIEKAHPDVFNILLQILEDGRLTDAQGRTVDFRHCIVIMTSNIGASEIARNTPLGFAVTEDETGVSYEDMKGRIMGELKKVFRPEFLNRIDDVIVFHKLQKDEIKQIIDLLLLRIRESMAERELQLELSEDAKDLLVEKGWDPAMGARPLRRAIQRYIEDPLADFVLRAQLESGATVMVDAVEETQGGAERRRRPDQALDHPAQEGAGRGRRRRGRGDGRRGRRGRAGRARDARRAGRSARGVGATSSRAPRGVILRAVLVRVIAAFFVVVAPASAETLSVQGATVTDAPFSVAFADGPALTVVGDAAPVRVDVARAATGTRWWPSRAGGLLEARVHGPRGAGRERVTSRRPRALPSISFAAAAGRVVHRDRRAVARGRPARARGPQLRRRRADAPGGPAVHRSRRRRRGARSERDDDTYYPVPWVLSSRGYGVLIDNDETSSFDLAASDPARWSASVEAARLSLRVFAGPRPADALARFTAATGRQPRRRRAVGLRAVVPDRAAERRSRSRRRRAIVKRAARRRRAGQRDRDADALPARAARTAARRTTSGADRAVARRRAGAPRVLQPAPVRLVPAGLRRGGGGGRAAARRGRRAVPLPGVRRRQRARRASPRSRSRSSTSPRPATEALLRAARPRGVRPGQGRLDGGLRRVHAAVRALGRRHAARADPQPLPPRLPLRGAADRRAARAAGHAPPAVGLDGRGAVRVDRVGRRPDDAVGLRRAELGGHAGADDRDERRRAVGDRTSAATSRSARATARSRARRRTRR